MSSGMVPLELSKDNNQYCKISVFMPNAGSINESVISVTNVGGDSFSVAVSMIRWNANKVFCKLINGTKISNINMYYTVDTERFCFYIKANWYAKIIVSRLGLVNTSKIESINAIPSGAIEVPISWRDKRYSTDLGGLLPLATNETKGLASMNMCIAYVGEGPVICIKPTNLKTYYYTLLTVTVYENGKFKKIDLAVYNPAKGKGHKCSILGDGNVFVKEDSDYNLYIYNASLNNATYCVSIIGCTKNINLQSITVEGSPASVLNGLILNDVATM